MESLEKFEWISYCLVEYLNWYLVSYHIADDLEEYDLVYLVRRKKQFKERFDMEWR